jgi:bifunctional non-homologous end joining protein LigD
MLAKLSEPFDNPDYIFEIKFDGTRCISYIDAANGTVKFLNRRMSFFENRYPELQGIWKNIKAKKAILDGEIVVFEKSKPNFYRLAEREHTDDKLRIKLLSETMPATYVVFDVLHVDGEDTIDKPLSERKKILERIVEEDNRILLSRYVTGQGKKFFNEVKKRGLEGIMAKKLDSLYYPGERKDCWLKIKYLKTLDCIICGYTIGTGWREKYFGALILGCYHEGKLRYVGRVGTGLDEKGYAELTEELKKLRTEKCPFKEKPELPSDVIPVWVKPKLICEVKFMNLSKDLIMRAPSFVRLRDDKSLKDCLLEF